MKAPSGWAHMVSEQLWSLTTVPHCLSSLLCCSAQFLHNVKPDDRSNRMLFKIRMKRTRTLGFWSLSSRDLPSGNKCQRCYSRAPSGACFCCMKKWFLIFTRNTQICSWRRSVSRCRGSEWAWRGRPLRCSCALCIRNCLPWLRGA